MLFWHDVGFQCARVSANKNTMKFRKLTVHIQHNITWYNILHYNITYCNNIYYNIMLYYVIFLPSFFIFSYLFICMVHLFHYLIDVVISGFLSNAIFQSVLIPCAARDRTHIYIYIYIHTYIYTHIHTYIFRYFLFVLVFVLLFSVNVIFQIVLIPCAARDIYIYIYIYTIL